MRNNAMESVADELAKALGVDAVFYLVFAERGGHVHKLTSIQSPEARVELLESVLEREKGFWIDLISD